MGGRGWGVEGGGTGHDEGVVMISLSGVAGGRQGAWSSLPAGPRRHGT